MTYYHDQSITHIWMVYSSLYFADTIQYNISIKQYLLVKIILADLRHQAFTRLRLIPLMPDCSFEVVKHVEAAELGLEDEDEEDVGTKDRAVGEASDQNDLWLCRSRPISPLRWPGPCYWLQRVYAVVSCASAKDAWTQGPTSLGGGSDVVHTGYTG